MSFLVAADARSADARRSIAETLAFAPAVASIAAFECELVALIDSLQAACEAAVEERLATAEVQGHISAAVSAAFDASRVEVGAEALAAIDGGTDWDATLADQRLERFAVSFGQLPDGVSKRRDLTALRGFVESRWRACSLDSLRETKLRMARVGALKWAQQHSERVATARAAAEVGRERALAAHCSALAQSDHLPIRVSAHLQLPAGRKSEWRVASLNVQEHCADGLHPYVSLLPNVRAAPRRSGAVERLVKAMMHPSVLNRQCDDVLAFVRAELMEVGAKAVCLLEVRPHMLRAVLAAASAAVPPWHVHACSAAMAEQGAGDGGRCISGTCIISLAPFTPEADVLVTAGKSGRTRAFAAATFAEAEGGEGEGGHTVTVVAVHVLHDDQSRYASGSSNASHISQAEERIASAYSHRLGAGGCVLAVGDFNGHLGPTDASFSSDRSGREGERVLRASPNVPTQYGTTHAVDGAVLLLPEQWPGRDARLSCVALEHPRAPAAVE